LKQLSKALVPERTPRRPPQTPSTRRTLAIPRTPGTTKKTPRGTGVGIANVATPHTARAVKQLQNTLGRSGGIRKRAEIRRESQRDVLRGLSRGNFPY
jgi:hypothetical protein